VTLKTGISGLRGTVAPGEESLTATTAVQWAQAFAARAQAEANDRPWLALGHDARRSSPALAALVRGALLTAGAHVLDLGLTLTPTVQLAIRRDARLHGGIMITASHNPVIWNGLKFLDAQGFFIPPEWWDAMRATIAGGDFPAVPLDQIGRVEQGGEAAWRAHLQAALEALPVDRIRQRGYRVALDACNGGAVRWAELLEALGCEPVLLHSEQHGFFAREAEPLPVYLTALRDLVRSAHCDLGLAADPDGDRLVLVDANGEAVSEEHTVVLCALALARRQGDCVVANVVTTHALDEALPHTTVYRTAVGEMNVVAGTLQHGAVLGGEGSGGIIVPKINVARDGLAAAGLVLMLMVERGEALHEIVATIPVWASVKTKLTATEGSPDALRALFASWKEERPEARLQGGTLRVASGDGTLELTLHAGGSLIMSGDLPTSGSVRASGDGAGLTDLWAVLDSQRERLTLDLTDGVKLQGDGAWLSLRPSNTEPIVRVMGEVRA
jgi:phosphomannomutase